MNGIEVNYDKTVTISRLTSIAGTDTEQYTSHIASLPCHIQPLDDGFSEDQEGSMGKDSKMFCPVLDILENDKVTYGSISYLVVGVRSFSFLRMDRHMEIRLREFIK